MVFIVGVIIATLTGKNGNAKSNYLKAFIFQHFFANPDETNRYYKDVTDEGIVMQNGYKVLITIEKFIEWSIIIMAQQRLDMIVFVLILINLIVIITVDLELLCTSLVQIKYNKTWYISQIDYTMSAIVFLWI